MSALSPPQEEVVVAAAPKRKRRRLRNSPRTLGQLLELRIMQVAHRIDQVDMRIEQVERRIDQMDKQIADTRQEMRDMRQEATGHTNFLGVMIVILGLVITVAISIAGWYISALISAVK